MMVNNKFGNLDEKLSYHLSFTNNETSASVVRSLREKMDSASHHERMVLAGTISGYIRRFREMIIKDLTYIAVSDKKTTRSQVRSWQQRVFGQSCASSKLRDFSSPELTGGGRLEENLEIDAITEKAVSDYYKKYRNRLSLEKPSVTSRP